ncbi:ABC transporter substrate-binding protein [Psychromicrobium xiongbiense]|uniref:ABC transporter substrate-binding protein n=1 Tax=Psychromicrobium xiongbiense TaxID=3051184 RepID=UPI0025522D15|nr:ABC transporter substrate-binding protein [Psychromicrobium sp. YIM S02556]
MAKGGLTAVGLVAALALSACSGGNPLSATTAAGTGGTSGSAGSVIVGSADFTESQVLGEIYAGALQAAGVTVTTKPNIGSREVYVKALDDGSIDVVPDYSGNLLGFVDKKASATDKDGVLKALPAALSTYSSTLTNKTPLGILDAAQAEDKDAMVVTKVTAQKYNLKSIEDLAKVCKDLTLAAPPEFATRDYGLPGLKGKYGCEPKKFLPVTGEALTIKALIGDDAQVADVFTTSPAIPDNSLVVLSDPKNNWLPQQVLPLYNTKKLSDVAKQALNNVSKQLTTDDLITMNREVQGPQKRDPKDAAQEWLKAKGITK